MLAAGGLAAILGVAAIPLFPCEPCMGKGMESYGRSGPGGWVGGIGACSNCKGKKSVSILHKLGFR